MTLPTTIKHGSADWWVLQSLRDFGAMTQAELFHLGTHETPEALKRLRQMHMVAFNHDKLLEIQPKGRKSLAATNHERVKRSSNKPAAPRVLVNSMIRETYVGTELRAFDGRPGAMDAFELPSVMMGSLVWRDGRTSTIKGAPCEQ